VQTLPLRPWTPDEGARVLRALNRTFLTDPDPATDPAELALIEPDRTLSAWDDGEPVATTAAFSLTMAVPGAHLPVAGVTWVSVQPTHRRRGLLTAMMTAQLDALHEGDGSRGGEAVAALWASEPAIYGRYGYGAASRSMTVTLQRGDLLRPDAPAGGRVHELPPESALPALSAVWEATWRDRPGQFARSETWWRQRLLDPESGRHGHGALRCALLLAADGRASAYALYAARPSFDERGPAGEVQVREVVGVDAVAGLQMWRFLLGLDLVGTWKAGRLALDDALTTAVADARRLLPRVGDGLYVRLVRVGEALAGRRYACDVDVVLEVADERLPGNARRWRLSAGPGGATCTPTPDPADLALDVEALGATYLGGTTLLALAAAGRVREQRTGALAVISRALRGDVEPLCSQVF
jgi:predicted acetyltransferase